MKCTIEPTPEIDTLTINGQPIPLRIWKGVTSGGVEIEALVLSIVPERKGDADRMHAELPPFMMRSRDAFDITIRSAEDEWAKSMHETGGPPPGWRG